MTSPQLKLEKDPDDLARWYFNTYIESLHGESGVPADGIDCMRESYVRGVRRNSEAQKQIKDAFKRAISAKCVIK